MSDADSVTSDNVPGSTSDINSPQTNKRSCDTTTKSPHKSTTFSPARKKLARTTTNEGQLPGIDIDIPIHITDLNSHTDSGGGVAAAYSPIKFQPFFGSTSNVHNNSSDNNYSNIEMMGDVDGFASEDLPTLRNLLLDLGDSAPAACGIATPPTDLHGGTSRSADVGVAVSTGAIIDFSVNEESESPQLQIPTGVHTFFKVYKGIPQYCVVIERERA